MKLSTKQISHLRGLAHHLSPVVMIADKGLTENIFKEIEIALNSHELIKVKVAGDDRDARKTMYQTILNQTNAVGVHQIGKQFVLYRPSDTIKEKSKIIIPK